nr:MAG TPA: hypothetical protein [Caudoviricetes sp.]
MHRCNFYSLRCNGEHKQSTTSYVLNITPILNYKGV